MGQGDEEALSLPPKHDDMAACPTGPAPFAKEVYKEDGSTLGPPPVALAKEMKKPPPPRPLVGFTQMEVGNG